MFKGRVVALAPHDRHEAILVVQQDFFCLLRLLRVILVLRLACFGVGKSPALGVLVEVAGPAIVHSGGCRAAGISMKKCASLDAAEGLMNETECCY